MRSFLASVVAGSLPVDEADMTPMARSFYMENKRVHNDRIKDELGIELIYPNYRVGLEALMKETDGTESG